MNQIMDKNRLLRAGHYEIQGETIAKFEFFDNGFNPYSRYLDVDKVDLLLRKRDGEKISYLEIQVKYGKLYRCGPKWEQRLFDYTTWRFFRHDEFADTHANLYLAYVMSPEDAGYQGDIFIFPVKEFNELIKQGIACNTKKGKQYKVYIAHSIHDNNWYLWKRGGFIEINDDNVVNVTKYRRNFNFDLVADKS